MRTLALLAAMGLVLLFVWERVDIVTLGYHIERLKAQKVLLERERDELQVKFSAVTSPERIARAATEKLAMNPPQPGQVIVIHPAPEEPTGAPVETEMRIAKNIVSKGSR